MTEYYSIRGKRPTLGNIEEALKGDNELKLERSQKVFRIKDKKGAEAIVEVASGKVSGIYHNHPKPPIKEGQSIARIAQRICFSYPMVETNEHRE